LALSLLVAVLAYPHAAISETRLQASRQVVPAEDMGEVNLGEFGAVPVLDLVEYYMENPPPKAAAGVPVRKVRFQGC
jgi:hypothetical protein